MGDKEINPIEFEEQHAKTAAFLGIDLYTWASLAVSSLCFVAGLFFSSGSLMRLILMLVSFVASGYGVVSGAVEKLLTEHEVDEKLLVVAAAFLSFLTHMEVDGAALMLFYCLTHLALRYVSARSERSVMAAVDPRANRAVLLDDEGEETVDAASLKPGDTILLRPGDVFPVDAVVLDGYSTVDLSAVTGQQEGRTVEEGDSVPSGARNLTSQLQLEVAAPYNSSTMDRMWELLRGEGEESRWEDYLEKYRRLFVPVSVALTAVLTVLFTLIFRSGVGVALHRALVVLIVANPAAFAAALAMTYFIGMHGAARRGVIFKGHGALDAAANCKAMVFDRDGTVTSRDFRVEAIHAGRIDADILLKASAHAAANASAESMRAIVAAYGGPIDYSMIGNFVEYPEGISVEIDGIPVLIGSRDFLLGNSVTLGENDGRDTPALHVSLGGQFAGSILLSNSVQPGCQETMSALGGMGCRDVVLLSEEEGEKTAALAQQCGIHKYYAQCLPMDKLARIQEIRERNSDGATIYVTASDAEGANFACADAGMYLGALDGEGAAEAQIIAMGGSVTCTAEALRSAGITDKVLKEALLGILAIKAVLLLLSLTGLSTALWFAALLDGFAAVGAVLNAVRAFPPEK